LERKEFCNRTCIIGDHSQRAGIVAKGVGHPAHDAWKWMHGNIRPDAGNKPLQEPGASPDAAFWWWSSNVFLQRARYVVAQWEKKAVDNGFV
jgi:hypothetical protein